MNRIEVTTEFHHLCFLEAHLFFEVQRYLSPVQVFPVWGAELLTAKKWPVQIPRPTKIFDTTVEDAYCAGFGWLEFYGVVGGEISISPYDNHGEFVRDRKNEPFSINKKWGGKEIEEAWCYEFLSVLDWPHGYCHLKIWGKSGVFLNYPPEKIISSSIYGMEPQKWQYNGEPVPDVPFEISRSS